MRSKKTVIIVTSILILCTMNSMGETKKLKQIGRYAFVRIKGEVPTSEVMKALLERYIGDIKYGFDMAGYGDLYLSFIEQIKTGEFVEKEVAIGDKFMWMLFRSRGKIKVVEDVEWAGKKPLHVFLFKMKKDYKLYEFVMPKPCGNIALLGIEEAVPDAVCNIKVSPVKANINDPISVDMSDSQHAKSMEIEIYGPEGTKTTTKTLTPDSPKWQTKFANPGEYVFKAKAINMEGNPSENPCEAKVYINFPPICKLSSTCLPCEDYVGRPIVFDASQSTDPDGSVVKAGFEIIDETGTRIDTYSDADAPFAWEKIFQAPGIYTITTVVTDDFGAMSQPCKLDVEVTQKRNFFFVDAGPLWAKGSLGSYAIGRVGYLLNVVPDTLDFVISGGGAIALKGNPWKSFFTANVLLNIHAGPAFFGAGAGFSTKVKENIGSDAELIANIGFEVFNNWTTRGSLFFEGRGAVGTDRSFSKNHKLMLGFRLLF